MTLLGIEIGGTKLQAALGDDAGRILRLERRAVEPARGAAGIRERIEAMTADLVGDGPRPSAVGIGFGGPVDTERGVVLESHQIEGWTGFPLADWIRTTLGVDRVALQNDADTAGLGEATTGSGRGTSPVLYVTIGSGIGGGLIVDGAIYRGFGGGAVEIGHLFVRLPGEPPRKLEHVASGWAIGRYARERLAEGAPSALRSLELDRVTGADVSRAAEAGDPFALAVMDRAVSAMIQALAHAVTLLAPRRIILGGGVSLTPDRLWLDPIRSGLDEWVFPQFRGAFELAIAALGEEVVLHGALALARSAASV